MEGILKVTPEQLISTANEFQSKGTQIQTLTSEMTDLAKSLSSVWEGEAATTYVGKFNALEDDIQKMIRMIQEHVTDLNEMARGYSEAERANVEEASSLSGDVIV